MFLMMGYVPEICQAKNSSIKLPSYIKLVFTLFHEEDARSNNPQIYYNSFTYRPVILPRADDYEWLVDEDLE